MVLTKFWEQNKKFLILAGSGLAIFLILNTFISSYVARADKLLRSAAKVDREIRALKKELNNGYALERNRLANYEEHEEALLKELELPLMPELSAFDKKAPRVQFNQAIDRMWQSAIENANRVGVAIPEKLGPEDFGIKHGFEKGDYQRFYDELSIVGLALNALVEAEMSEILVPELLDPIELPIRDNTTLVRLRGARFKVVGSYDSYVRVLKLIQQPGSFLQARLVQLFTKGKDDRSIHGVIEFGGIRLHEPEESA